MSDDVRQRRQADVGAYCRAIESHLCRKNDGHLVRISGPAEQAMAYKMDPTFPNRSQSGKIQVIAVSVSMQSEEEVLQRPENAARKAWLDRTKSSIDYAALAALLD